MAIMDETLPLLHRDLKLVPQPPALNTPQKAAIATFSVLGALVFAVNGDEGLIDNVLGPLTVGWKGGVGPHVGYVILIGTAVASAGLAGVANGSRRGIRR